MGGAASESAAAPVPHNAADPVELNDVCRIKLKLLYQTDSDAALLQDLIHQLGSAHEWSGVWTPYLNAIPINLVPGYLAYIVQVERIGIISK